MGRRPEPAGATEEAITRQPADRKDLPTAVSYETFVPPGLLPPSAWGAAASASAAPCCADLGGAGHRMFEIRITGLAIKTLFIVHVPAWYYVCICLFTSVLRGTSNVRRGVRQPAITLIRHDLCDKSCAMPRSVNHARR
jgi:hypothetical protein